MKDNKKVNERKLKLDWIATKRRMKKTLKYEWKIHVQPKGEWKASKRWLKVNQMVNKRKHTGKWKLTKMNERKLKGKWRLTRKWKKS